MLPRRQEFSIFRAEPRFIYMTDINNHTLAEVERMRRTAKRPLQAIPEVSGGSQIPWVIAGTDSNNFRFAIHRTLERPADDGLIDRIDRAIPDSVPKNVPFVLENIGVIAASAAEERERAIREVTASAADQREQRRYYIIG